MRDMPRLSRYPLTPKQVDELAAHIVDGVFLIRNKETLNFFFQDLLTRTEKAMLGKRILIALLLEKEYSYKDIRRWLKVSENTIANIRERLEKDGRGFRAVLKALGRREKVEALFERFRSLFEGLRLPTSKLVLPRRKHIRLNF